jgi:sulfite oxidase
MTIASDVLLDRRRFLVAAAAGAASLPLLSGFGSSVLAAGTEGLVVHGTAPMNAEGDLAKLVESWMTPVENFYIRSHAPVPKIDNDAFRLLVEGLVERPLSLSLKELAGFDQHSAVSTMTCAGNRRSEHSLIKPVKGVPWREGAIGNAKWTGVLLSDVLKKAGLKEGARHVWFEGLDEIERSSGVIPFGASIPIEKAMADTGSMPGALLTTKMNDAPLNGDHGAPLRTVVPGYIGARSVKWLGKIVVSDRPSPNHYVATAYKLVENGTPVEWAEQGPIYRMPLNSVICTPKSGTNVKLGEVRVAGYALPPGRPGATVSSVEVSADGGRNWMRAKVTSPVREYCWVLWSATIRVSAKTEVLLVRATNSRGETQPRKPVWNMKGYLFNGWHQVGVDAG